MPVEQPKNILSLNRLLVPPTILICGIVALACIQKLRGGSESIDFEEYWRASQVTLSGLPAAAYGIGKNPFGNFLPIAYPPPFLFFIAPTSLVPVGPAFLTWILVTGGFCVWASRTRMALAHPSAAYNGLVGQNGFLTTGILLIGLRLLSRRPAVGGAILGMMVIKPQLALALPIVVIAGRLWIAIPAAAASAASLLALAVVVFGPATYVGFFYAVSVYGGWFSDAQWPWAHMASMYAVGMWFGLGSAAWALHGLFAILAAAAVWISWRHEWESKVPIAASASLLISPYLFPYDGVLLVAPLAYLANRRPIWAIAVWVLAGLQLLLPLGIYYGPPTTPLAAAVAIAGMVIGESPRFMRLQNVSLVGLEMINSPANQSNFSKD